MGIPGEKLIRKFKHTNAKILCLLRIFAILFYIYSIAPIIAIT